MTEYGLEFAIHHPLFLRLDIVANGNTLGHIFHVVFFAIAEAVDGEVALQAIAAGELINTAQRNAEAFITHLVVGTTDDGTIGHCVGAVGDFI